MKPLPYVTEGYDLPEAQPVAPGKAAPYIGIYVLDEEPRIVMTLKNPFGKFGTIECWLPLFECALPIEIKPSDKKERFFQIAFTGVPGTKEEFPGTGLCCRAVTVKQIKRMFEGENPPMVG